MECTHARGCTAHTQYTADDPHTLHVPQRHPTHVPLTASNAEIWPQTPSKGYIIASPLQRIRAHHSRTCCQHHQQRIIPGPTCLHHPAMPPSLHIHTRWPLIARTAHTSPSDFVRDSFHTAAHFPPGDRALSHFHLVGGRRRRARSCLMGGLIAARCSPWRT